MAARYYKFVFLQNRESGKSFGPLVDRVSLLLSSSYPCNLKIMVLDLPVYILHRFLQDWCASVDLVRLDSALCVHKLREKFLRIIVY